LVIIMPISDQILVKSIKSCLGRLVELISTSSFLQLTQYSQSLLETLISSLRNLSNSKTKVTIEEIKCMTVTMELLVWWINSCEQPLKNFFLVPEIVDLLKLDVPIQRRASRIENASLEVKKEWNKIGSKLCRVQYQVLKAIIEKSSNNFFCTNQQHLLETVISQLDTTSPDDIDVLFEVIRLMIKNIEINESSTKIIKYGLIKMFSIVNGMSLRGNSQKKSL